MDEIKKLSESKLLCLYADTMEELRNRKIIRSSNNPVADYGEYFVAKKLKLELLPNSYKEIDAIDNKTGKKYQIKSRRVTKHNSSRQLGVLRNLEKANFDYLIAIFFDSKFNAVEIFKIPKNIIKKYAKFSKHQNGHILIMKGKILNDEDIVKI